MTTIITTDSESLRELIHEAVANAVAEQVPGIVRKATRKEWLTKAEVLELTGWSSRTLQHLRTSRQIPFSKHDRKIMYPAEGVESFMQQHRIIPRGGKKKGGE